MKEVLKPLAIALAVIIAMVGFGAVYKLGYKDGWYDGMSDGINFEKERNKPCGKDTTLNFPDTCHSILHVSRKAIWNEGRVEIHSNNISIKSKR